VHQLGFLFVVGKVAFYNKKDRKLNGYPFKEVPMQKKAAFLLVLAFASIAAASCGKNVSSASTESITSSSYSVSESVSSSQASKLRKAAAKVYVETDGGVENQDVELYFVDGYGDVPFLQVSSTKPILERSLNDSAIAYADGVATIGRSENTGTIIIDFNKKTVTYPNLDLYAANHGKQSVLNLVSDQGKTDEGRSKYMQSMASVGDDTYRPGSSISLDIAAHNVPLYLEDGEGYIPVQTFADLVFSERNIVLAYNGKDLFMSGASFSDDMKTLYYSVDKGNRSEKMARFSRDELTLAMDLQYGLKNEHSINSFDSYFKETGLDDKLLSLDPVVADQGIYELCARYLGDFHSYLDLSSPLAGQDAIDSSKKAGLSSASYQEYQLIRYAFATARTNVVKALSGGAKTTFDSYEQIGDVAYVTFDNFTMPASGVDYYKTAADATAADTYGIIEYAHSQIFKSGSTVKRVVLDLSCNSGGSINAGAYVAGWFLPYSVLNAKNSATGAMGSFTYASDVNMDGVYDKNDRLTGLQLYCIVSPASFSCSNFVSSIFRDSDQVRLLGRKTGGGSCIVQHLSVADGTLFNTSGNRTLCSVQNGSYYSIDRGIDVDFGLDTYADYFNRTALTTKIDAL
jgi:hypothetical protein